ncbi:MAG TPA: Crp/Fnr family transcriptional regulator [Candidatus Saccharimonadales bacterium]|nr:Crp/Fnr family transcriptional regulator [Candidatus Saccharimonadales bacterium]
MPNYAQSQLLSDFFKTGQPTYVRKGDLIIGIEPEPKGVYFVDTGFVKAYSITDGGEEFVHIVYGHGEIFPFVWAYRRIHPELYYEALNQTLLWRVSREQFTQFAKNDPKGAYELARQMAQQFQVFTDRLDNLEYKKSSERIAYRLLFLAGRFGKKQSKGVVIDAPVTHDLIARSINLTRESVSRELEKLEREKIIERSGHKIFICDVNALSQRLSKPNNLKHWGID